MSAALPVGTVLGTFEQTLPLDFTRRLDAILTGAETERSTVPPGAFVFFAFLPDLSWMDRTGVDFARSLAVRRQVRILSPVRPGDRLSGRTIVTGVEADRRGRSRRFVTIGTDYAREGQVVVEESVTYLTVDEVTR